MLYKVAIIVGVFLPVMELNVNSVWIAYAALITVLGLK